MLQQRTFFSQLNVVESDVKLSQVYDFGRVWDKYRAQSLITELIYSQEQEFYKLSVRIKNCSNFLRFSLENESFILREANFCRVRYCQICAWRKSLCRRAMLYRACEKIKLQNCNYNFIFLTLTVKNCRVENLRETLGSMRDAWHKLIKREQFINATEGWIRSVEITRDSKQFNAYAHPHFHCVLAVKSSYYKSKDYICQKDWAQIWRDCLQVNYTPVVDIRSVKNKYNNKDAVKCAIIETLKYSVKHSDISVDINNLEGRNWFYILTQQTYKLRFFSAGGIFKDAIKDDSEISNEDLVKLSNNYERLNDEELFNFVFCRNKKYYEYKSNF